MSSHSRVIVVTGASRGLGRALVGEFIAAGHTVAACARSAEAMKAMQSQYGNTHSFGAADLTDETAVQDWASTLLQRHGAPDLLINNAAAINRNAPLWAVPPEEFRQIMAVNVMAVYSVIRHLVPAMIERNQGVIANLSSGWGRSVSADMAPYCASKWAIEGMTQALAADLPRGMAAVAVNPGVINTDMLKSCFGEAAAAYDGAEQWAIHAAPFFLNIGPEDNGRPLSAP